MAMLRCMNCMEEYNEKNNKCPHCGFVPVQTKRESGQLPQETVLQRRYVVGCALKQNDNEIIYIGWDQVLEKKIAIKEYFPGYCAKRGMERKELFWESEEDKAKFMRGMEQFSAEAQRLARFREDTGIIRIYDSFEENGTAYTITEYSDSLRGGEDVGIPDEQSGWQQKKRFCYAGLGIGAAAVLVMLLLLFLDTHRSLIVRQDAFSYERIPDMTGMPYEQAEKKLEEIGVKIQREKYCLTEDLQEDIILCQNILSGRRAEQGTVVKVVVTKKEEKKTTEAALKNTEAETEEEATTEAATRQQTTQQKTTRTVTPKTTEKKTTAKKTEKKKATEKKTEKKTEQEKTTEKVTTEEVIVIEE